MLPIIQFTILFIDIILFLTVQYSEQTINITWRYIGAYFCVVLSINY